jgi:tRNA-Thr(GGU) m(6)t(6)A37 methyltransferase TsaA
MKIEPIGVVHSPFKQSAGTPIQPAFAQGAEGTIEVFPKFNEALSDLEGFERIWLLCWLDRASEYRLKVKPYLDRQRRGLFATRAPSRPNPIGLSCVRLLSVEGNTIHVADIDILDGTPLLDIKPYVKKFDYFDVQRNGWLDAVPKEDARADDRFHRNPNE